MLQLFTTRTYQDRADEIYRLLGGGGECPLELFEWRVRMIHILNMKIMQRSADMGRGQNNKRDVLEKE